MRQPSVPLHTGSHPSNRCVDCPRPSGPCPVRVGLRAHVRESLLRMPFRRSANRPEADLVCSTAIARPGTTFIPRVVFEVSVPINQERARKLMEHGLTEYQARVYLTLLDLGAATATQISPLSKVPRTRIYATMQQLHQKGLVQILPETP